MKSTIAFAVLALAVTARGEAQQPKLSPVFEVDGPRIWPATAQPDGDLIYYRAARPGGKPAVFVFDPHTGEHRAVRSGQAYATWVSRDGRLLVYEGPAESGEDWFVWAMPLDPKTGIATGQPRRVSMTPGEQPALSNDGRLIAFVSKGYTPTERVLVVPANGGPERTLLETKGTYTVSAMRWAPDDQSLWFDRSDSPDASKGGIYRVPVTGGTPQLVMRTGGWEDGYPGLSSDGRLIVAWAPGDDTSIVTTSTGRRISSYIPESGFHPDAWMRDARALTAISRRKTKMFIRDLAGGEPRLVSDTGSSYFEPSWSPDGKRMAAPMERDSAIMIFREGRTQERIATRELGSTVNAIYWSADGNTLAYRSRGTYGSLSLVSLVDRTERQIAPRLTLAVGVRWMASGRALRYGVMDSLAAADSGRTLVMHEVSTAGVDRPLRTLRVWCPPQGNGCVRFLTDSTMVFRGPDNQTMAGPVSGPGSDRSLVTRSPAGHQPTPTVSPNGRWIALRDADANGQQNVIHVIAADGSSRHTITLPFRTKTGANFPTVGNDGRTLLVAAMTPGPGGGFSYYRVDVATGTPTALFSVAFGMSPGQLSPDGRSVVYSTFESSHSTLYQLDYTDLLKVAGIPIRP